jgi:hypothetical protein
VELLFLNMHNLINAFRPHQARETVIQMLKTQVQERRDAARDIRRTIDESRLAVERVHGQLHESTDDAAAANGASPAGTDEDVKMENVDGSGAGGGGAEQATTSAASAVALTPAQQEQAEVRRLPLHLALQSARSDGCLFGVMLCLRAEGTRGAANAARVFRGARGCDELTVSKPTLLRRCRHCTLLG